MNISPKILKNYKEKNEIILENPIPFQNPIRNAFKNPFQDFFKKPSQDFLKNFNYKVEKKPKFKNNFVEENSIDINDVSNTLFDVNFLIQKKSFINSFTENFQFYSYRIINYMLHDSIYKDDVDIYDRIYIASVNVPRALNFVFAVLFDKFYFLFMLNLPLFNYFFKNVFNFSDFNILILNNPEYYFIFEENLMFYYRNYFSNIYPSIFLLNIDESFLTPIFSILQFFSLIFFVTLYMLLYFIYFNYIYKEDSILDHDFLSINVTIEAEEEIGSMDDILMSLVILLFLFLWFFWINSWITFGNYNSFMMSIFLFPLLYFIIFLIPLNLLYDYGSYFLPYLNGVGKSAIMLMELLFDYIATSIFFLRLIVQNVRLIFMIFTYSELHELVIFYTFNSNLIIGNESLSSSWQYVKSIFSSKSYSFVFEFLSKTINWLYELFHTFFMIIFQFIAFFAMVFWLFLFLYTMFVIERQEAYLLDLKMQRFEYYKKLIDYKNNLNANINSNLIYFNKNFNLNKNKLSLA